MSVETMIQAAIVLADMFIEKYGFIFASVFLALIVYLIVAGNNVKGVGSDEFTSDDRFKRRADCFGRFMRSRNKRGQT